MTRRLMVLIACVGTSLFVAAGPASASCLAQSEAQARAAAHVIFEGVALPGPLFHGERLAAPYRFRVERYLKGDGPGIVTVHSGPSVNGVFHDTPEVTAGGGLVSTSVDLGVSAGQRLVIYAGSVPDGSLWTSACSGSHPVGESGPFFEPLPPPPPPTWLAAIGVLGLAAVMGIGAGIASRLRISA